MKLFIVASFLISSLLNCPLGSRGTELFGSLVQQKLYFSPCDADDDADCENFQNTTWMDSFGEDNGTKFCEVKMKTKLGQICKNPADCNIEHSICNQDRCRCEEVRMRSDDLKRCLKDSSEPCISNIGSLCNGLDCEQKPSECQTGKCECPEERPYCTNQADDSRSSRPIKGQNKPKRNVHLPKKGDSKEKFILEAAPEERPNPFRIFQRGLFKLGIGSFIPSDPDQEMFYKYLCHCTIYILLTSSLVVVSFANSHIRRFFGKYILPFYGLVIVICAMWIVDLRESVFTLIAVIVLLATSCALLYIAYTVINEVMNDLRNGEEGEEAAADERRVASGRRRNRRNRGERLSTQ